MRSYALVLSLACAGGALLVCSVAAAQEPAPAESVVLLAPPEVRAEWTAALQLELAARGALAIPADAPEAPTSLLGDAEAQRMAIARGARAAVWAEARPDGWRLRMVTADAERARVVPVARDADARTVALILVSLLDGAAEPSVAVTLDPGPAQVTPSQVAPSQVAPSQVAPSQVAPSQVAPSQVAPSQVVEDAPLSVEGARALLDTPEPSRREAIEPETETEIQQAPEARPGPYARWSGIVGVSGFALANDRGLSGGLTLRAGFGMRYDAFEAAIVQDLGFWTDSASDAQPYGRACLEAGGATSRTTAAFHAGARGCFGSLFATEFGGGPGEGDLFFITTGPRTHVTGGGYAAVSFALSDWIRLFIRADLEVSWTELSASDLIALVPALSTYLSFE